jgi:hypothetical protein
MGEVVANGIRDWVMSRPGGHPCFGFIFAPISSMAILCVTATLAAAPDLPNASRTPGVPDPAVTQANITENICVSGYTATLRPNTSVTNAIKKQQLSDWGYTDRKMAHYEEDHLIPLQLGGSPDDPKNLWPEHYSGKWGARVKDTLEGELRRRLCTKPEDADHISLQDARDAITSDWKAAYLKYVCTRTKPALTAKIKAHCPQ